MCFAPPFYPFQVQISSIYLSDDGRIERRLSGILKPYWRIKAHFANAINKTSLFVFNLVPEESSSNEQKGDSTAAIAASVVVVLLLVGVAFVVGVIFWRR